MRTIKAIFTLIFSIFTLNSYSINTNNTNYKPKNDIIESVQSIGFESVIDKIQKEFCKTKDKIENAFDKKNSKTLLLILSIVLVVASIICPVLIIEFGFIAEHILLWLTLIGITGIIPIIGGIIMMIFNHQTAKSIVVNILNVISIIAGALASVVWLVLSALVFIFQRAF